MGRPREVVETAAVEPGGAGGRMHRGLLCGRGGGVVSLHTTARHPWEEPARSSSPPESQAGACCGRGAETACAGRWDWRGDLTGLPSSVRFSLARVSHAVHIAAAPGVKV